MMIELPCRWWEGGPSEAKGMKGLTLCRKWTFCGRGWKRCSKCAERGQENKLEPVGFNRTMFWIDGVLMRLVHNEFDRLEINKDGDVGLLI